MKVHLFEPLFRLVSQVSIIDHITSRGLHGWSQPSFQWASSSLNHHQTGEFPGDHLPSHNTYTHRSMPSKISEYLLYSHWFPHSFSWALNFSVLRQLETSPRRIAEDPEQTPKITDSSPKIRHRGLSNTGDTDFLVGGDVSGIFHPEMVYRDLPDM